LEKAAATARCNNKVLRLWVAAFARTTKEVALNRTLAPVLEAEIAGGDALVGRDLFRSAIQHELAELHHMGAIGNGKCGLRVRSTGSTETPALT
jgi:hypothetical protein